MYISIRYINSERIPRFSHESRFEFLNEIDRRTEREGLNPCPHSLLSYPLFRVETTRMQRQWWEDYRNRINRCFLRNRRVAIIGSGATPFLDSIKRNLPGGLSCSPRWDQFSVSSRFPARAYGSSWILSVSEEIRPFSRFHRFIFDKSKEI